MSQLLIRRFTLWAGLLAVLLLTWYAYAPGLSGDFLFDDFINLDALGRSGPIDSWPSFWRYLTSGTADPIGRPLSLLSFLIDSRDWPADPASFLRTNLILHLINGALLFALLRKLGRALDKHSARVEPAALLASSLWMLHPLFVSTTLYAVQREAMLPTTFVLAGLVAYGHGRQRFSESGGAAGKAWMCGGIVVGTTLALLSKANGALLPLLAWVLEIAIFKPSQSKPTTLAVSASFAKFKLFLLVIPGLAVLAYTGHFLFEWNSPLANRPWTIGQRVLTEPRILLEYLQLLAVPRSVSSGLYNDHFQASVSLWRPITTLPSLLLVAGLIYLAIRLRARAPSFSAAILFFFAGHLLESSAVPLELYFEHRNYLPALLLFWPLARALCAWRVAFAMRLAIAGGLIALLAITTANRAELWGKPGQLAELWAVTSQKSSRAQATAAMSRTNAGRPDAAIQLLGPRWLEKPADIQIASSYIVAACALPRGITMADAQAISKTVRESSDTDELVARWLNSLIDMAAAGQCAGLALEDVEIWLNDAGENPHLRGFKGSHQHFLLGKIALARRLPNLALLHYNRDLEAKLLPEVAAINAAQLASHGYFEHALAHLDTYERLKVKMRRPAPGMPFVRAKLLQSQDYWQHEMDWLRENLRAAISEKKNQKRGQVQ